MFLWSTANTSSKDILRRGSTNYLAIASLHNTTLSEEYDKQIVNQTNVNGLMLDNEVWIARTWCRPTLRWSISTCTWDGSFMRNCTNEKTTGHNASSLDTVGLDALTEYMSAVLWKHYSDGEMLFTWDPFPSYAPTTEHIESLHGVLAMSIVNVASMTSWGTVEVQTVGEPMRQVYIVRVYVLFIVAGLLLSVTLLAAADVMLDAAAQRPFQKTSFLSIARAVRGDWWDETLGGKDGKLAEYGKDYGHDKVIFASDLDDPRQGRLIPECDILSRVPSSTPRTSLDSAKWKRVKPYVV
jgi:hypothetical protein